MREWMDETDNAVDGKSPAQDIDAVDPSPAAHTVDNRVDAVDEHPMEP